MNIVITMAGLGSRFKKAGYKEPKYMINVRGKSLFEWSMESLIGFNNSENLKYIFIVRKENDAKKFIEEKMHLFGVTNIDIIEIDYLTDGQATTAMLAKEKWIKDEELLIYNIDTYVEANCMREELIKGDGYIPCFKAEGDHWSFVKLDEKGNAIEVREKERISDNCTVGLYYFKSCELYEKMYNEYYAEEKNMEKNEKYIAPIYNYMISKGYKVNIEDLPVDKVHVLGTPEEVKIFEKKLMYKKK
jgi:dTDP-glucose pyrophosphorylase